MGRNSIPDSMRLTVATLGGYTKVKRGNISLPLIPTLLTANPERYSCPRTRRRQSSRKVDRAGRCLTAPRSGKHTGEAAARECGPV